MNPLNYASIEASKRLDAAGIKIEADHCMAVHGVIFLKDDINKNYQHIFSPAPSMADVLRELPEEYCNTASDPILTFTMTKTHIGYTGGKGQGFMFPYINPTDALIDLLIWLRKVKP